VLRIVPGLLKIQVVKHEDAAPHIFWRDFSSLQVENENKSIFMIFLSA
jgi:hypothetical protein